MRGHIASGLPRLRLLQGKLISTVVGFVVAGNFSGNLSFWPYAVFLGILLGQCALIGDRQEEFGRQAALASALPVRTTVRSLRA